jgi:hypothetical protein
VDCGQLIAASVDQEQMHIVILQADTLGQQSASLCLLAGIMLFFKNLYILLFHIRNL